MTAPLVGISVYNHQSELEHAHLDIEFIYVIKGCLQVNVSNNRFQLYKSDFVLINSNEFHSFRSETDNLFVVFHFSYSELCTLLEQPGICFSCYSNDQETASNHELRMIVEQLLTLYIKLHLEQKIEFIERVHQFVFHLALHYLESARVHKQVFKKGRNGKIPEILTYIHAHYHQALSLEEVASRQFFSAPYLSKLFKKQTGQTFYKYLNEVRLAHAVHELQHTEKPVTRIALDNGFPNLSAFNRVFQEHYQAKPAEFRKQYMSKAVNEGLSQEIVNKQLPNEVLQELRQYLGSSSSECLPLHSNGCTTEIVAVGRIIPISKYWNKVINIGYAKDMLNSDLQEQIILMREEIGFTHARFWGLFSDEMLVEDRSGGTVAYNFSNTNKVLDFLLKHKLKPFIELGPKPKVISKKLDQPIVLQEVGAKPLEEWKSLARAFLLHCVGRYGNDEVESWYFEIWSKHIDPFSEAFGDDCEGPSHFISRAKHLDPSQFEAYFLLFSAFKKIAQEIIPSAKVGGCGLSMELEDDKLDFMLRQWKTEAMQPDFLSVYLYPIEIDRMGNQVPIRNLQSANHHYERNKLSLIRKSLKKAGFEELELNVTEWNISPVSRDYIHDSCFKASYLVKSVLENLNQNQVNMLGYWLCSDISSDFRDSQQLLHGGAGLLTKSGIKKPSYHAFVLLNQIGDALVARGNHYIVTKKSRDRYQVLCFNYKHFNYSYYLHPEGSIGIQEQYQIFEDSLVLKLLLELKGIANGKYRVKEQKLNRSHGSVLDEWLHFGAANDMKQDEVKYLKQICVPSMKVDHIVVEDNVILLNGELEPHEVRLYEIHLLLGDM